MAGTVQGREIALTLYNAATFGEIAGVSAGEVAYRRTNDVTGQRSLERDDTLSGFRGRQRPVQGNMDPGGSLNINIAPASVQTWLRYIVGSGSTHRPATPPSSPSITGVTIVRASKDSATGDGTLSYTNTSTTLDWAEQGDTAGAAVDVSGGGTFTLSSTSGETLTVEVEAGSLPGTDESDTVTVVDAYEHVFKVSDGIPTAGFILEKDYGSRISTADRFDHIVGCQVGQAELTLTPAGFSPLNMQIQAADVLIDNGAALDATPDDFGHKAFDNARATIKENGTELGVVQQLTQTIGNNLDADTFVVGGGGRRASLDAGMVDVTGSLQFLMQDRALTKKGYDLTESNLVTEYKNGTGDGTEGNEYLSLSLGNLVYNLMTEPTSGPNGVRHTLNYEGFRDSGEVDYTVVLRNQREALTL